MCKVVSKPNEGKKLLYFISNPSYSCFHLHLMLNFYYCMHKKDKWNFIPIFFSYHFYYCCCDSYLKCWCWCWWWWWCNKIFFIIINDKLMWCMHDKCRECALWDMNVIQYRVFFNLKINSTCTFSCNKCIMICTQFTLNVCKHRVRV
jgi:hypothetical protein